MKRSRGLPGWSSVALVAGLIVALVGLGTPAQAGEASHWSAQRTVPRPPQDVRSVSCPRIDSCTALTSVGAVLRYDGRAWGRARSADHDLSVMTSVSCPSPSFCAAVGPRVVVVERRGRWGTVHLTDFALHDVSCVSRRWCLAVGDGGRTLRYDGTRWRPAARAARADLSKVSCVSRHFCMATTTTTSRAHAFRWTAGSWRRAGGLSTSTNEQTGGLSCGSPQLCIVATDNATSRWNGRRWVDHTFTSWDTFQESGISCGRGFCELLTTAHCAKVCWSVRCSGTVIGVGDVEFTGASLVPVGSSPRPQDP